MKVVFTDLDGTLLDESTYSFQPALPALAALGRRGWPVVLTTSKTRAEVEELRRRIGLADPYIVENGAAICWPEGGGDFILAAPHAVVTKGLRDAASECGAAVLGFSEMTLEEVAGRTGLPLEGATLAAQREYDEPFVLLDAGKEGALGAAIERRGLHWSRGGRFHHIFGHLGKGAAVARLMAFYRRNGAAAASIGLGDAPNDAGLLEAVDQAVIVRTPRAEALSPPRPESPHHASPRPRRLE